MKTSQEGIELIKRFEGCRLKAYKALESEPYYTIGYGHYGPDVLPGSCITQEQATEYLKADLAKFEKHVDAAGKWGQHQFDALVSFTYNCGPGNLKKLVRNRTKAQIADAILLYCKAGGLVLQGLVRRRKAERGIFLLDPLELPKPVTPKPKVDK